MTDTVSRGPAATASSEDRVLAAIVYALLFLTPFFAGVTALIAVVLAYVRRPAAEALSRSHYAFQIRMFWIGLVLLVLSVVLGLVGAGVLITHFLDVSLRQGGGWDAWDVSFNDNGVTHLNLAGLTVLVLSGLLLLGDMLWLMLASVFGVARLLSGAPIGRLKAA